MCGMDNREAGLNRRWVIETLSMETESMARGTKTVRSEKKHGMP